MAKRKYLITVSDSDSKRILMLFRGSRAVIITVTCAIILCIMAGTYFLTSRTAIRHTIPGYPSEESRQHAMEAVARADSLERVINMWSFQMTNIRRVLEGREPLPPDSITVMKQDIEVDDNARSLYAESDSLLKEYVTGRNGAEQTGNDNKL